MATQFGPLDFAAPVWFVFLLLLVLFLPVWWLWKHSRVPASPFRRRVSLVLRMILLTALVFSLVGTRLVWLSKGICVVFVIDQSQSVPGSTREDIRNRISLEVEKMDKDDLFVVVEFGGDAVLGSLPSKKGQMPQPVKVLDTGRTDIARALRLAMATLPSDHQKRVVLFSDGNQNAGDALRESRIAANNDVDIDVLLVTARSGHEVMIDQVIAPAHVQKDAHFVLRTIISADQPQSATLHITRDGVPQPSLTVQLKTGTNVIDLPDSLNDGGFHQYAVTLSPKEGADTFSANNNGYAFTQVDAPGKVLYVRGRPQERDYLSEALRQPPARIAVDVVSLGGLPASVNALAAYDTVIIDNVPAGPAGMSEGQMVAIRDWVKNHGGGLVLIGGDQSYGPGLWKNTPIEEVSPVEMEVKRQKHLASLAMVVVLDKSGSMGAPAKGGSGMEKMQLANAGAVEAVKLLDPQDEAMVGAVDTEVKWMIEARVLPMSATNKSRLIQNTKANQTGGGGIYCKTALVHAYGLLTSSNVQAQTKHVILFADAQDSDQQEGCRELAAEMFRKHQITTSVIGMGVRANPHVGFQEDVAKAGHGRFDITDDVMNLPRIFAKETFIVSRNAYVEDEKGMTPTLYQSPLLEGFLTKGTGGVPKIYGYVGTTIKPRATLAMHGKEGDDPLLAHWSIGLGKAVAFTSDSTSRWGKDWVQWGGNAKFWAQVMRWVGKTTTNANMATNTTIDAGQGRIVVEAVDAQGKPRNNLQLQANVTSPDQNKELAPVVLEQIGPGRYTGNFPASNTGTYMVTVHDDKSGEKSTGGGILSYAPEYRDLNPNAKLLKELADASGGRYLSGVEGVFGQKPDPVKTFWPLWQVLMIVTAAGLFLDIAWRRLNLADWFSSLRPTPFPVVARGDTLGAYRNIKSDTREVAEQRDSLRERIETRASGRADRQESLGGGAVATLERSDTETSSSAPSSTKPVSSENYTNRLMGAKKRAAQQIQENQSNQPPTSPG